MRAGTTGLKLLLEPAAVITGRVVDESGKVVAAKVWTSTDGVDAGSTLLATDAEGKFRLEVPLRFAARWGRPSTASGIGAGNSQPSSPARPTS